jgi:hypothetical protein
MKFWLRIILVFFLTSGMAGCGSANKLLDTVAKTQASNLRAGAAITATRVSQSQNAQAAAATPAGPTYLSDIAPLMQKYCVACHSTSQHNIVILDDYTAMIGDGTILNKWTESLQYAQAATMPPPPAKAMAPADLQVFAAWVAAGADQASQSFQLGVSCSKRVPTAAPIRRLTNFELATTLNALLPASVTATMSNALGNMPSDSTPGQFDVLTAAVSDAFLDAQYSVAKAAGVALLQSDAARSDLVPCWAAANGDLGQQGSCLAQFIPTFTETAFRRPLTSAESSAVTAAVNDALTNMDPPTALASAVQRILFSPTFYLLPELDGQNTGDPYLVNSYVLAARLSYTLWGSAPDAALYASAKDGSLSQPAVFKTQAERLLASPQFAMQLNHIVGEWLQLDGLTVPEPSGSTTASTQALIASMQNDLLMTVQQVTVNGGTLADLFSTSTGYVDSPALATIYGLSPGTLTLPQYVTLDPTTRGGFLTRAGMLAYDASPVLTTIRRGRFIRQNLLGQPISNPPNNVALVPGNATTELSLRDRLTASTTPYSCSFCHNIMNPLGFALGNFAPDGSYQTTEVDIKPDGSSATTTINATVDPRLDVLGRDQVTGGAQLSKLLGQNQDVRITFAKNWYSAFSAQAINPVNACVVSDMYSATNSNQSILDMIRSWIYSPEFLLKAY